MKRLVRIPGMKILSMLLLLGSMFTACNVLTENEEDCAVYVRFRYDMNMEFTNSFSQAVNSVTLYAFDKNGVLVFQKTEEGELLKQDGYRMQLDNTVGIIDSDYYYSDNEGHIFCKITCDAKQEKEVLLKKGSAFIQGIFLEYGITVDDEVTEVRNGGFGSTSK